MSTFKRWISALLALCLCLSVLPTAVFAADADRAMGSAGVTDSLSGDDSIIPMDRTDPPSAFGIDVSHHQGTIDWDTVASQIDFAIIRCGYGDDLTSQDDRQWVRNVEACTRLGIPFGVYIYSYALSESEAISEADHVLRLIEGYHPTLPIYFDLEDQSILDACSTTQILNITRTFCNKIEAAGYRAGVYANQNWWTTYLTSSEYDQWDRWIARYASAPGYNKDYTIWQYSSTGSINGISGNVDMNYWYGTFPPQSEECSCSTSYAGSYTCTTTSANLLIRSGHGTGFDIVGRIPSGATVYVSKASGTGAGHWAHVEYDGITGFASMEYLERQGSSTEVDAKISKWISHEAMGDSISSAKVGDWVYLCYRMYDANSGNALNVAVPDKTYTVTETIYNPDGSVRHTYTYDNADSNWLGIRCLTAGTYTYEIVLDGGWIGTFSGSFVVEPNPVEVHATSDQINLTLGSDESEVIYVWSTGYNPNSIYFSWGKSNDNISCTWGDWEDDRVPLTISANSAGTTTITLSVHDSESTAVLDTCTVNVTVTANTYTVSYNANGGSGAPSSQTKTNGVALTLSSAVPTRFGYTFLGWSTSSTATSATYLPGGSFAIDANTTLYAVWKANTYTISYNANGGSGAPASQTKTHGVALTLCPTEPTRPGYTFLGWATSSTATTATYQPGSSFTTNANTILYAVWKANTYTISYNANGGTGAPASQTKTHGVTLTLSTTKPTRSGYTFMGWATSSTATSAAYQPGGSFTTNADTTLYAVWTSSNLASGTCGSNLTWTLSQSGVLTVSGSGTMKDYTYKSEMPWYSHRSQIKSVVVESGVTSIGAYAFYGMPNMESIVIPQSVTAIGSYAFKNATALDDVILPAKLSKLGESAFYGCTALTAIDIPASLYTVQPYTFKNCAALAQVTFHEGNLQKISDGAFYGTGLTELVLPDCMSILDMYSFKNCAKLRSIQLGSGLTQIREAVFYGTAIPTITIPEGVTSIGPYAFKNCTRLMSIDLPSTLTSVGEASFYACTALESLDLPDAVTKIGNYAFRKCAALLDVSLGANLVNIGESSFYGCESIVYLRLPSKVTTIQGYAFKGCTDLEFVTLPGSLTTLGDSAFHSCTSLSEVTIPAKVTKIGEYCFSGSTGIDYLYFLGNAPAIGSGAFNKITATAYYPSGNATWTASVRQNYGGSISWVAD